MLRKVSCRYMCNYIRDGERKPERHTDRDRNILREAEQISNTDRTTRSIIPTISRRKLI